MCGDESVCIYSHCPYFLFLCDYWDCWVGELLLDFFWRAKTGKSTKLMYCPWVIRYGLIFWTLGVPITTANPLTLGQIELFWNDLNNFVEKKGTMNSLVCVGYSLWQVFLSNGPAWKKMKTEPIRKLSNFNFQWTKTLYQSNLNNTAFKAFFKGYRHNLLSVITPKTISHWSLRK